VKPVAGRRSGASTLSARAHSAPFATPGTKNDPTYSTAGRRCRKEDLSVCNRRFKNWRGRTTGCALWKAVWYRSKSLDDSSGSDLELDKIAVRFTCAWSAENIQYC